MKLNVWIVAAWAPLTSVMVLAQDTASTPAMGAAAPAAETAPAAPTKKGSSIKTRVLLDPPAGATVKSANVNVRGQASFNGEVVGHLQKGDTVTVLEQITLRHPGKDEPAQWAQIVLPAGIHTWVNASYVNAETSTIKARKVNVRGGPGENYSMLGLLEKGAVVKELKKEKGWIAIEAPTNAYAYVAAEFLEMLPPGALTTAAPAPPTQLVEVNTPAAPAAAAIDIVAPTPMPDQNQSKELEAVRSANATAPAAAAPAPPAAPAAPVDPRLVTRSGFVRRSVFVQAPTVYELHDVQSGDLTDFLQAKEGQDLKTFVGTRISVTGIEGIVKDWPHNPVLQVQTIDLMP
jgi:uncharacterized protein YgiM (DUF1202 family)